MAEMACITAISTEKLPPKAAVTLMSSPTGSSPSADGLRQRHHNNNNNNNRRQYFNNHHNHHNNNNNNNNTFLGKSASGLFMLPDVDEKSGGDDDDGVGIKSSLSSPSSLGEGGIVVTAPPVASSSSSSGQLAAFRVVRPLGSMEEYIAKYNERGLGDIVYALHLKSKVPVPDEIFIRALRHLQTKVQHLRLAIQDDGYQRFFVELRNPEIVFKNCGSREWRDLFEEMLGIEYDAENGPLWQARVTRMGREDEASCQIVNGCVNHGYVLLIGFHHSITDGTSNAKFCTILLKIVNALLTTGSVPEGDEVTLAPSMWDLTSPEHMQKFRVYDPRDLLSLAKDCYNYGFNERSQYLRRFPPPKNMFHSEIRSGIVTAELTTEITTELIRACKRKGVTVSGAFTAAAGIAIYNLITRPEGPTPALPKGKRKFGINHAVNLRRYFDKSNQDACGCYFNFFDDHVTCDENSLARFWEVAHEATISIHQNVDNARGLKKQRNLDFIFNYLYPSDWYCSWRRRRALHSANSEFSTSNLGAVDKMFNGVGTPVETIKMFRSTAMHYLPSLFTWFFQTFRGRFTGLLEFFTNFVTRQQAQDYIDETMRVLIAGIDLARLPSSTELMTSEVIAR